MNRSLVQRITVLAVMTVAAIFIMMKVESADIKNNREITTTKKEVVEQEQKLDSLKAQTENEEKKLERIKAEKSYLQKMPQKSDIKKIKFK